MGTDLIGFQNHGTLGLIPCFEIILPTFNDWGSYPWTILLGKERVWNFQIRSFQTHHLLPLLHSIVRRAGEAFITYRRL